MQYELFREDYRLREKASAKARNIRVEVRSGREVVLVYPRWVARADALAFLQSRTDWVREKLREFAEREAQDPAPPDMRWDGCDELLLRGVSVPVRVEPARLRQVSIRLETEAITVFAPKPVLAQPLKLAQALRRELMHQAQRDALRMLDHEAARLGVRYQQLKINDPQTLWGSCNPGGVICLSWRLVMAPPEVFRYVVIHELCHLLHPDHSTRFWSCVERQMPDFAQHRHWLQARGLRLQQQLPKTTAQRP